MFHASLAVQLPATLPSPTDAVKGLIELLFPSTADDDEPNEELRDTLTRNLAIFEALLRSFEGAGFDDVVAIFVDGKGAYVDTEERFGDIHEALEGVVKSRAVDKGFAVMRTTFRREIDGLEVLGELRCHARSSARPDETRVRISARPREHAPGDDEGPKEYAGRVRAVIRDPERIESHRAVIEALCNDVGAQIEKNIPETQVAASPAVVRFVEPGRRQLGRMRHLGFGTSRRRTVHCALPSYERVGPFDDPLAAHYYSPYSDLFHWIAIGEVLAGQLASAHVEVVSPTGRLLFRGSEASGFDPAELSVSRDVVRVSPQGQLKIDSSIAEAAALEPEEKGSPQSRGWAGEAWAEDIDEG